MKPWETAPEHYETLLQEKCRQAQAAFEPFEAPAAQVFASPPHSYRVRAEFRIWHEGDRLDYVMFDPKNPRVPVPVEDFVPAVPSVRRLMPRLRARLETSPGLRRKLFQVEFLAGDDDLLLTLIYHRKLDEAWEAQARELAAEFSVEVIGRSRGAKHVLSRDYVLQAYPVGGRRFTYRQYEQSFVQPNGPVNEQMLGWVWNESEKARGDLLELYCGNGNFTLPLATRFASVLATELSKIGTRAAKENIEANGVDNVEVVRLSAQEVTQALAGERSFRRLAGLRKPIAAYDLSTVFVDPPRAGLDPATLSCVKGFERILYISCNPKTLIENLEALERSHRIEALAFFDQFPYTPHLECGVVLVRP